MYFEVLVTLLFLFIAILGVVGMVLTRPKRGLPPSFSAKASDENSPERGSIFVAIFGAVAMVGVLGSATFAFMNGPLRSSIFLTNRNIAATQMNVAAQMAVAAAAAQDNGGDCDGDGIIEPLPFRAKGTDEPEPPTGGGYIPSLIGTSKTDPWGRPYGYCVWDHGTEINDSGCGGASQNRRGGAASDGLATVAIISSGSDRAFQTTCNNFSDTAPADGQPDVELVAKADGSDDLITLYTYVEAMGASSGLWQLKSGSANTATIGSKDIEVGGNASFSGQVITDSLNSRSGRLDVNDPLRLPDETAFPACTAELVGAVRRYQGAIEICGVTPPSTYAFQPVGGGAASIDELSDAATDYASGKYSMYLGYQAGSGSSGGNNTALGYYAFKNGGASGHNNNTAIGAQTLTSNFAASGDGADNTAVGYLALNKSKSSGLTAVGSSALANNTYGLSNTALGYNSLNSNTTGGYNTSVGYGALQNNSTTSSNTAVGYNSLNLNTGSSNTAVGWQALNKNRQGNFNTAVGYNAMLGGAVAFTGSANTALGGFALQNVQTSSTSNVAVGYYSLWNNYGSYNTGIGDHALYWNAAGTYNTALGYQSNYYQSGSHNIAIGHQAMYGANPALPTGSYNVAVGDSALRLIQGSAGENVAIGYQALSNAKTMSGNTAIGHQALMSITDGYAYSTAVGYRALATANNGGYNTAVGYHALEQTTTGTNNTAVGLDALAANTTGGGNTGIGMWALQYNTTGGANSAMGVDALASNQTGSSNTVLGYQAMVNSTEGSYNAVVGNNAGGTGSNNVAMGYFALGGSGQENVALGIWSLEYNTTGSGNVGVGYAALDTNTTGSRNTALGYFADVSSANLTNATAIGNEAKATASNSITLGNSDISAIYANVTSITAISDRRLKKDIGDLGLGLDFLRKLRPVEYKFNNGDDTLRYGFIAQEVETALPDTLQKRVETAAPEQGVALLSRQPDKNRTYRLSYGELTAPLVKAVQEIAANDDRTTAELRDDIAGLKRELAALRNRQPACAGRQETSN